MKVVIIEDEDLAQDRLEHLIHAYDPTVQVVAKIDSLKGAITYFQNNPQVDLIFIDIQLSDGVSFDLFEKLEISIPVIFTTAFSNYTFKAFKVNVIDYLLKPVGAKELKAALEKFKSINHHYTAPFKNTSQDFKEKIQKDYKYRFVVKAGSHLIPICVDQIGCFASKEGLTFIYTKDKKRFPIDYSLDQLETMLSPEVFFRVSRKHIININYIDTIANYSSNRLKVLLKDTKEEEEEIVVSREKVQTLKQWLDQ